MKNGPATRDVRTLPFFFEPKITGRKAQEKFAHKRMSPDKSAVVGNMASRTNYAPDIKNKVPPGQYVVAYPWSPWGYKQVDSTEKGMPPQKSAEDVAAEQLA